MSASGSLVCACQGGACGAAVACRCVHLWHCLCGLLAMGCQAAVHLDVVTAGLHGGGVGDCVLVATWNGETQGLVAAKSKRPLVHDRPALPSIGCA